MRFEAETLREALTPLVAVHGVELVAVEWLQGPGRGVLRLYIDRHGADPRTAFERREEGITANLCAAVSRDVSAQLDVLDPFDIPYDLEVSSPGFERPVQKRADFERFAGLTVKLKTRAPFAGPKSLEGPIIGTSDLPDGSFAVRLRVGEKELAIEARAIARARLAELPPPQASRRASPRLPTARSTPTQTPTAKGARPRPRSER